MFEQSKFQNTMSLSLITTRYVKKIRKMSVTSRATTQLLALLLFSSPPVRNVTKWTKNERSTATYKNICSSKKRATESFLLVCFGNCLIELSISFSANIADVFVTLKLLTPSKKRRIRTYLELAIVKSLARQFKIIYLLLHHDHSLFQAVLSKSAL